VHDRDPGLQGAAGARRAEPPVRQVPGRAGGVQRPGAVLPVRGRREVQAHHRLPPPAEHLQARGLAGYLLPRQAGPRPRPRLPGETLRAMDWKQIVLFAILGLGAGSLIAGIAVGIVVTFRGSGIINLATGAVAMVAGYSYWSLKTGTYGVHVPTAPALAITFAVLLVLGLGVELCVFRPLRTAAPLAKLAASLGLLLVAQAA